MKNVSQGGHGSLMGMQHTDRLLSCVPETVSEVELAHTVSARSHCDCTPSKCPMVASLAVSLKRPIRGLSPPPQLVNSSSEPTALLLLAPLVLLPVLLSPFSLYTMT